MHITTRETKTKGVRWVVSARDPTGKQRKGTFDSYEEAQLFGAEVEAGQHCPTVESMTFGDLAHCWWQHYADRELQPITQKKRAGQLRRWLDPHWGHQRVQDITPLAVLEWVGTLERNPALKPITAGNIAQLFKQILRWGVRHQLIAYHPADVINFPQYECDFDYWEADEVAAFLEGTRGDFLYPMWMVELHLGLRISELAGMDLAHIHLEEGRVHVCQRLMQTGEIRRGTKGSRPGKKPRSRWLGIPDVLRPIFVQLKQQPGPHAFSALDGTRMAHRQTYRHFKRACERVGVRLITFHSLRHTFASHFMMNGGDLYDLKEILGHKSVQVTERYAHLSPSHVARAANVVSYNTTTFQLVKGGAS